MTSKSSHTFTTLKELARITCITLVLSSTSCKTTNPQTAHMNSADETQKEIKTDIVDLVSQPTNNLLAALQPLANQFKSIQQLKAKAEGALREIDVLARQELDKMRSHHNENALLWEMANVFAGPDRLFNYQDVNNTLQCMTDQDIKATLDFFLTEASIKAQGYVKEAIGTLRTSLLQNSPLPTFRDSVDPISMMNQSTRPREIQNEINRQLALNLSEQCAIPRDQICNIGVFDLVKKYCIRAMEWRAQGVLAGILNLHYNTESIDRTNSCDGRRVSADKIKELYTHYIVPKINGSTKKQEDSASLNYLTIQTTKYFGPFDSQANSIEIQDPNQNRIINNYLNISDKIQVTLRGGIPVAAVKEFMDDFVSKSSDLLGADLSRINRNLRASFDCKSIGNTFVPRTTFPTEKLDITYYQNEEEFRAYYDPEINGTSYINAKIKDQNQVRVKLEEMRTNKINGVLRKTQSNGITRFLHQTISGMTFFGDQVSTLAISQFTKVPDGRVRLDSLYLEQASGGTLTVSIQRPDTTGGFEIVEYEGYAIPYTSNSSSFATPCIEFTGLR